jgi:hypothetical protein
MKTYQLVLPPTAPELPCVHKFTRDASTLANAPLQTVILVTTMSDTDFNALPTEKIFS